MTTLPRPRTRARPSRPAATPPSTQPPASACSAVALSRGGDYADLFFEYRAGGGFSFDEGILKAASRGVSVGVGVRVQRGDATGYAYIEDLTWESMRRAAETAAQIASAPAAPPPSPSAPAPCRVVTSCRP